MMHLGATISVWIFFLSAGVEASSRIVGGTVAPDDRFQYQVSIQSVSDSYHLCSGVIVDPSYILTTAVCCEEDEAELLKVVSGVHDLEDQTEESETLIESVTIHEDYDGFNLFNNICMMKLQAALASESSQATLPISENQPFDDIAEVSGWGATSGGDIAGSTNLLYAEVPIVNDAECFNIYGLNLQPNMICAGGEDKDACDRDQGGPLTCVDADGEDVVCGLVSFGLGDCATPGVPGVYTEVGYYATWINDIVTGEGDDGGDEEPGFN